MDIFEFRCEDCDFCIEENGKQVCMDYSYEEVGASDIHDIKRCENWDKGLKDIDNWKPIYEGYIKGEDVSRYFEEE